MKNSPLVSLLNRFAWFLSGVIGANGAFLICDLASGTYTSAAENFLTWGWIWTIIFLVLVKKWLFSEDLIQSIELNMMQKSDFPPQEPFQEELNKAPIVTTQEEPTFAMRSDEGITLLDTSEKSLPEADEEEYMEESPSTPQFEMKPTIPDEPSWFVAFFSDRPLAKIGGIILILGAFFFLSLIWASIGAVGQIIISLLFGFTLYGTGVWMDTKGNIAESRTLLGVGITINTLTILSGRWILGDTGGNLFSDSLTLFFLVLNTVFAVVTGLVYNSRTFLIFSFAFAYIIPFLVRSESDSTILMFLYIAIISLGGHMLVWFYSARSERKDDMEWLFRTVTMGSLILLSLTGFGVETEGELIFAVCVTLLLTVSGIFVTKTTSIDKASIPGLLISAYITLASTLFGIGDSSTNTIYILFVAILPLMIYTGISILTVTVTLVYSWILLIPLLLGLLMLGIFGVSSLVIILIPTVLLYGIAGIFLLPAMVGIFQYVFFLAISAFLIISSVALDMSTLAINTFERNTISIASILFFILSLWSSYSSRETKIALISVISSSFIFAVSLSPDWDISWVYSILFLLIAFLFPFFSKGSQRNHFPEFIGYQVVTNIFLIGELFYLGKDTWFNDDSSSLITLGIIIFIISLASLGYIYLLLWNISDTEESMKLTHEDKSNAAALLGIPLSFFTLAIAVTFSESPMVVSTAWILESTVLAYYMTKSKNRLVFAGSLILLIIGIMRLLPFVDTINTSEFFYLIPVTIIALSLFFSLACVPREDNDSLSGIYDFFHIFGIATIGYAVMKIIPHTSTGWSLLGLNLFLLVSAWFYSKIKSNLITVWVIFLSIAAFSYHFARFDGLDISFGPVMIQLSSLGIATYAIWYLKKKHSYGSYLFIYAFIMVLLITSLYVNKIFDSVFFVTIYLTLVSSLYLIIGINDNVPKYRTIGLYIGSVVLIKILFYDIWVGVDNYIFRVIALMITGGIMIAISQMYGRRVNRSWEDEFAFSNFFPPSLGNGSIKDSSRTNEGIQNDEQNSDPDDMPFDEILASDLKKIDISHIASINLVDGEGNVILLSKRAGMIRIANYLLLHLKKNEFVPHELDKVLLNVLPHIQSSLPKNELENLLFKINLWIEKGGKILLQRKK